MMPGYVLISRDIQFVAGRRPDTKKRFVDRELLSFDGSAHAHQDRRGLARPGWWEVAPDDGQPPRPGGRCRRCLWLSLAGDDVTPHPLPQALNKILVKEGKLFVLHLARI